jgi:cell division initiation protein
MRYTPVELRHIRLGRSFRGYRRSETEKLIEDIADSFEEVWRERGELADKVEDIESVVAELKQREALLATTLISAEKAAADAKDAAKREAELIVAEAHQEARSITRAAHTERERLFAEVRRVQTLLRAALGLVEESEKELPASDLPADVWPNRQDTREFQAVGTDPETAPEKPPLAESPLAEPPAAGPELPNLPNLPPVEPTAHVEGDESPWAGRDFAWG